ncbi:MAG: OmpA family protein [Chlorobi bacterium]|nr:OmpA family protein [Chlorobiota bacterium]
MRVTPWFLLFLFLFGTVGAQVLPDPEQPSATEGVYGGINLNLHGADFTKLPGIPNCCPKFTKGLGTGLAVGLMYEMPVRSWLFAHFRLGFSVLDAVLSEDELITIIVGNQLSTATVRHEIRSELSLISFDPMAGFAVSDAFRVYVGFSGGLYLAGRFEQDERLIEPASFGTFENGRRTRNEYSGDIPEQLPYQVSALTGARYQLPLNAEKTLFLSPEIWYYYALSPVVSGLDWNAHQLRLALSITYSPTAEPGPPPPTVTLPEIPPPLPRPTITAFGVDSTGKEFPEPRVQVEEFTYTELHPLLPYVFFDENSSRIPGRYHLLTVEEANAFSIQKIRSRNSLDIYYHLLNIVGKRMRENPDASITLVGCNSDEGREKGNLVLSRNRALAVQHYLNEVWDIHVSRMNVEARNLPEIATHHTIFDGIQENRRVEIRTDDFAILEPVLTRETSLRVSPDRIRFKTGTKVDSISRWELRMVQDNQLVDIVAGEGQVPANIDWRLPVDRVQDTLPIRYYLTLYFPGKTAVQSEEESLPIEYLTIEMKKRERKRDRYIERYSLILFPFDQAVVRGINSRILEMVRTRIRPEAKVTIEGFTDRIGDTKYNYELSLKRSREVARELGVDQISVQAWGESRPLFDNDLPEGRNYNRTVIITVETPVQY